MFMYLLRVNMIVAQADVTGAESVVDQFNKLVMS